MYNYSYFACRSNDSDNFLDEHGSVILSPYNQTSFWTIFTLTWSSIGLALSGAALALLILTATLFAEWRQNYKNQLLIQFMLARFFYASVRYFSDIQNVFKMCPSSERLLFLDILTIMYSEMVLVTWMFVFSRQMYISLVKMFATENNIWKVSACAWLVPAAVSIILQLIFYSSHDSSHKYFVVYIVLIKWPVLIANAVLLSLALRSVLKNNKQTEKNVRIVVVMIMMIFVFCFQQMIIDVCKMIFIRILTKISVITNIIIIGNILAMYHCAFSVVFWVLGNANTRKLWRFQGKDLRGKIRLSVRFSS